MVAESPRVLLADDEDTFRRSTARLLEQEGYRCDCAQDSQEASRVLTKEHDVLISDIRMPGNIQFEFLREVRSRFPLLPIVLVTGYPSVQTAVELVIPRSLLRGSGSLVPSGAWRIRGTMRFARGRTVHGKSTTILCFQ
jgi:CheY-like chemotaxis protein